MAEVMKFDDFKNEGSEAAVKVNIYIYTLLIINNNVSDSFQCPFNVPSSL